MSLRFQLTYANRSTLHTAIFLQSRLRKLSLTSLYNQDSASNPVYHFATRVH